MRAVHILFLACMAALLALPTAGLAINLVAFLTDDGQSARARTDTNLAGLPRRIDQFVSDMFGFREVMISQDAAWRAAFASGTRRVERGSDGFLFLKDNGVFSQVTGQRLDEAALRRFVAVAAELKEEASRNGRVFLTVVAPNKETIYRHRLPFWARAEPAATELDLLYGMLDDQNIKSLDVRRPLLERAGSEPVYWRSDTHWTRLGMAVAFNRIADSLDRRKAEIDIEKAFQGVREIDRRGDLAAIGAIPGPWPELEPVLVGTKLFDRKRFSREVIGEKGGFETYRLTPKAKKKKPAARARPTVLVIGDSFTAKDFGPLFMRFAGSYVWTFHRFGAFDRGLIERFDPDIVVLESVERSIVSFRRAETADTTP